MTEMEHVAPAATLKPQSFDCLNGFDPPPEMGVIVTALIVSAVLPVFVSDTTRVFCGWCFLSADSEPKSSVAGVSSTVPLAKLIETLLILVTSATDCASKVTT